MESCLKVFENNLDNFIKISINDRSKIMNNDQIYIKCGVLFINFNKQSDNVTFIPLDKNIFKDALLYTYFENENIIDQQFDYFSKKYETLPKSFIFFSLIYNNETLNIEYDLDKNNSYSKHIINKSNEKD